MKKAPYPFNAFIGVHVEELQHNLDLIKAFASKYPDAEPTTCSVLVATIRFPSSAADWCRDNLGPDGWVVRGSDAHKEVDGVEVELAIKPKLPETFTL
jgi:hypothetical protein